MYIVIVNIFKESKKELTTKIIALTADREEAFAKGNSEIAKYLKRDFKDNEDVLGKLEKIDKLGKDSGVKYYKLDKLRAEFVKTIEGTEIQYFDCLVKEK